MSDLTAEEFVRNKIREQSQIKGEMRALWTYKVSGEDALRWAHEFALLKANGVSTSHEQALHKHGVTNRTCVTCLYCQINPTSEFMYDRHKCTLVKPFVSITDATKFICDDWTEIPF